eukprot:scpid104642/ scgid12306/ 
MYGTPKDISQRYLSPTDRFTEYHPRKSNPRRTQDVIVWRSALLKFKLNKWKEERKRGTRKRNSKESQVVRDAPQKLGCRHIWKRLNYRAQSLVKLDIALSVGPANTGLRYGARRKLE